MNILNALNTFFSDPTHAGVAGMLLFGGMFIYFGWSMLSAIEAQKKNKHSRT